MRAANGGWIAAPPTHDCIVAKGGECKVCSSVLDGQIEMPVDDDASTVYPNLCMSFLPFLSAWSCHRAFNGQALERLTGGSTR
jgi:hypothetical protein